MAHVGVARFGNWVVIPIDNAVQVSGDLIGNLEQLVVVKCAIRSDKFRQGNGSQIANCNLVLCRVLNDFGAEVRAANRAEVLG